MTKTAYFLDLLSRSFFVFLVAYLLLRRWWWGVLISLVLNVLYECTVGRKTWQQFRNTPRKSRRPLRVVLADLWRRVFSRERTKGLVWAGVVLLLMSLVVQLSVYYVVCAVVVFSLAAISRFAPPPKSVTMDCEPNPNAPVGPTNCPPPATE